MLETFLNILWFLQWVCEKKKWILAHEKQKMLWKYYIVIRTSGVWKKKQSQKILAGWKTTEWELWGGGGEWRGEEPNSNFKECERNINGNLGMYKKTTWKLWDTLEKDEWKLWNEWNFVDMQKNKIQFDFLGCTQ